MEDNSVISIIILILNVTVTALYAFLRFETVRPTKKTFDFKCIVNYNISVKNSS